jgi:hypothetical protein
MKRCTFKDGSHYCGSYAFNLYSEGIDQGDLCDVHYWQDQAQKARADEREQSLDKKAENARELGLDYEPEQEPVAIEHCIWARNGNTPCPHTTPPPQRKPLTDEQERKEFEQWYVENVFDFEANPIGSRQCGLQWSAWKARAAHGIKENT